MELKFKETEFGTEIIGLDKELRQVGREGLLEIEIERLRAKVMELEAEIEWLLDGYKIIVRNIEGNAVSNFWINKYAKEILKEAKLRAALRREDGV